MINKSPNLIEKSKCRIRWCKIHCHNRLTPMKPSNPKQEKVVKAWVVCDFKGKPLDYGALDDKPRERMFMVYSSKKEAERQWNGFKIMEIIIPLPPLPKSQQRNKVR